MYKKKLCWWVFVGSVIAGQDVSFAYPDTIQENELEENACPSAGCDKGSDSVSEEGGKDEEFILGRKVSEKMKLLWKKIKGEKVADSILLLKDSFLPVVGDRFIEFKEIVLDLSQGILNAIKESLKSEKKADPVERKEMTEKWISKDGKKQNISLERTVVSPSSVQTIHFKRKENFSNNQAQEADNEEE